ncbi:MAG: hypothetical protein J7647_08390 [Cyanobacteria bacterium SBLK]|nr:hypothetical protein [Cyanobacteria bacterium SBLK]
MPNDPPSYTTSSYNQTDAVAGSTIVVKNNEDIEQTAREIQALLNQLSEMYPTETLAEKAAVAEKAIAQIKSSRSWFETILETNRTIGIEAFVKLIHFHNPIINILRVGLEEAIAETAAEIYDGESVSAERSEYLSATGNIVVEDDTDYSSMEDEIVGADVEIYDKDRVSKDKEIQHIIDDILTEIQSIDVRIDEKQEVIKNLRLETQVMMAALGEVVD